MRNGMGRPVLLRQLRVLNWHSIYDRTIEIPDTGLLIFGTNGSGKTSLQDALQYALFPDLRTIRFNTAVADTSHDRNLLGYVLQRIEDDGQGRAVYAHQERTTYVAIAFERGRERQTFLVGVEGHRSDMTHERLLASLSGIGDLRELPLLDSARMPLPLPSMEKWLRAHNGHVYDKVETYIGDVSTFNGSPSKDWPQLLKSSIGFKGIGDATQFVRRFLAEHPIDHEALLQTFQSYEDLRATAERTEGWIALLSQAVGTAIGEDGKRLPLDQLPSLHRFRHYRDRAMMYRVGDAMIPVKLAELVLADRRAHHEEGVRQLADAERQYSALSSELRTTRESHRATEEQLRGRGLLNAIESLEDDIRDAAIAVEAAQAAGGRVEQFRAALAPLHQCLLSGEVAEARELGALGTSLSLLQKDGMHRLLDFCEGSGDIHLHTADRMNRLLDGAEPEFSQAMTRLEDRQREARAQQAQLVEERDSLRRGRPRYLAGIESARAMLRDRVGWSDARPLAEMLEVPEADDLWRDAVEAELAWARYYFVVPPKYFQEAQRHYEQYRIKGYRNDAGRTEPLFNVSLVDVAKLREKRMNRADQGSLAEKVQADNADARDYVDFEIGRVACEMDSRRLREHSRAVTPDLLFYRGFRLSSHNRDSLNPCIGQAARARRLAWVEEELGRLERSLAQFERIAQKISASYRLLRSANQQYAQFRKDVEVSRDLDVRQNRLTALREELERIRTADPEDRELLARRDRQLERIQTLQNEVIEAGGQCESLRRDLKRLDQQMTKDSNEITRLDDLAFAKLEGVDVEVRERGLEAYERELASRIEAAGGLTESLLTEFHRTCGRQTLENDREAQAARDAFAGTVGRYQQETGFLAQATVEHPEALVAERQRLVETALPEQKKRLATKAREMREGVVQNVLHTLGARFGEVERLVEEINRSTTRVETRLGHFKLVTRPATERASIYRLALDAMTVLNFDQAETDSEFYRAVELFMKRLIENPRERDELCDYRKYFDFQVHNRPVGGAEYTPFRGTRAGGSGGERQVPFYVMTLALMDHLYRQGVRSNHYVGRLLLMDEVFHNMSDDNVDDVMNLAREIGLQIVMVTPGKLRTLAPRFGKTIQIAKRVISPREPSLFTEYTKDNLPSDLLDFSEYGEGAGAVA